VQADPAPWISGETSARRRAVITNPIERATQSAGELLVGPRCSSSLAYAPSLCTLHTFGILLYRIASTPYPPGMAVRDSDGFGGGSDSDGFGRIPSCPAGDFSAVLYSLYGHFDPTGMGSGFGRIR